MERIVEILKDLEAIHSPSGFTEEVMVHIEALAKTAGIGTKRTNKGGLVAGNHPQPRLVIAGHVDTLGAMVSGINADGHLSITKIGGPILPSFEGEYVTIRTVAGKDYRGTLLLNNPAAHVNDEVEKTVRKAENMHIRLDAEVAKKEDTEKLGIRIGDFIFFDPRFEFTETGYIKSRFLDDKAGSAAMLDAMLTLGAEKLKAIPVSFFFSNYEEVGHGAASGLPETAVEMLVADMGVVGEKVEGDESSVSICVKDSTGPYDYAIRCKLTELAEKNKIPHKLDVFPHYGSDGSIALIAGYDIRVGLIGPGVSASHGMERTHLKGLTATRDLMLAYIKETLG
ncbi:MAG: M42 family metallopeptidase [Candidatus Edwardsbacteria bacterium]|nr:M42 family metallopeptidase [Candidatus Edwardsbacteria bacterium]MBU1576077.1 M42 family metallopeptidase [Candidatus Edwardsbacteria bacterium]MBU2463679.1 M42 family metallopeptidase [Candidatus Edwardsbacteria bacterium]MBU2594147.1 M42 family metallopeptidase [Candidatus Edwardsbacteria bacterium]